VPPLPRLTLPALLAIERSLADAARDELLRVVAEAESLAAQLDAQGTYPEDWLRFRLIPGAPATTSTSTSTGTITGTQLRAELSPFVERLCDQAQLTERAMGDRAVTATALAERWKVSRQTLTRLRREGLIARRVRGANGRPTIVFDAGVVEAFERTQPPRETYSRLGPALEARMVARAARYHRLLGLSLNDAAKRIAARYGRSHEAVRQVLKRRAMKPASPARAKPPAATEVFAPDAPLDARRRAIMWRAWRLGVDPGAMARKYRRSRPAIRRALSLARADRLRALLEGHSLVGHVVPAYRADDGAQFLAPTPVRTGLFQPAPQDLLALLIAAREKHPPIAVEEKSRLHAYQFLRFDARRRIEALDRLFPGASDVDIIETRLRWAAHLKAELVRSQLRLIVETLDARFGRPLEQTPPNALPAVLAAAIHAAADTVDAFDSSRGGRLAAATGLAIDRLAARLIKDTTVTAAPGRRASLVLGPGIAIPDWTLNVCTWQRWLEPDPRIRRACDAGLLTESTSRFLRLRFGWTGEHPRTLDEVAKELRTRADRVTLIERRALAEALSAVRLGAAALR
jgi:hypothetical protein